MTDLKTYIARESAIGSVINVAIGSAFFLVLFRGQADPPVWGPGGLILDCLPQGFMIGLMSIIPSMLITRKRLRSGQPMPSAAAMRTFLPRGVFLRGLIIALSSMAGLVALAAALASITGVQTLPFWPAFALKALPGLIIPWIVIPPAIRVVLSSTPLISPLRT